MPFRMPIPPPASPAYVQTKIIGESINLISKLSSIYDFHESSDSFLGLSASSKLIYGIDLQRTGYYPHTPSVIYAASGDYKVYALNPDGTLKWSYATGGWVDYVLADSDYIYASAEDSKVYKLNPDGTLEWSFLIPNTGGYPGPAMIDSNDTVYFGSDDYHIFALFKNGTLKWKTNLGDACDYDSPIITNNTIYIGTDGTAFYILNLDGSLSLPPLYGSGFTDVAIDKSNNIYVADTGNKILYVLNKDSSIKWKYNGVGINSPAIAPDGTIYCPDSSNIYAINPDGTLKWKYTISTAINNPPVVGPDGTVYLGSYNTTTGVGVIYAINPDGTLKWEYTLSGTSPPEHRILVDANSNIYFGCYDKYIYVLNSDGTLKWRYLTGDMGMSVALV